MPSQEFQNRPGGSKAGVNLHLHVWKGIIHTYPLDLWGFPEAVDAFEKIELFLRQQLR